MEGLSFLLDTSVFIDYFRRRDKAETLLYRHFAQPGAAMSAITLMELEFGVRSPAHRQFLVELLARYPVLPFDEAAARRAAEIQRQLQTQNQQIEVRDLMIAATALAHHLPLATLDVGHFARVPGLAILSE